MDHIKKTYVQFLTPESLSSSSAEEGSIQEIKDRDVSKIKVPKNFFGFRFFDILSVVVNADGNNVLLTSGGINVSPVYYYGGTIYTLRQIKREFPQAISLIKSIEKSGHKKAIRCRTGEWLLFDKDEVMINVKIR